MLLKQNITRPRPNRPPQVRTSRYLSSSTLGLAVAEVNANGAKASGNIYAGGRRAAVSDGAGVLSSWSYAEPVTGSTINSSNPYFGTFQRKAEYDPLGVNTGFTDPADFEDGGEYVAGLVGGWGAGSCSVANPNCTSVYLDGVESDWATVLRWAGAGALNIRLENRRGDVLYAGLDVVLGSLYIPDRYQNSRETGVGTYTFSTDDPNSPIIWDPTAPFERIIINLIQGGFVSSQNRGQSPCEDQLARRFTDDPKAIFVDVKAATRQ